MNIKHNLLDIEGTTAPIAFVHQVLFPYAKKHITRFLRTYQFSEDRLKEIKLEFEKDVLPITIKRPLPKRVNEE